ncbi:MAG: hypothetical protein IKF16_12135 [Lachnospiraceae bacterium]|nr:hypothetical protein [Lachnospiraceae bacterium]
MTKQEIRKAIKEMKDRTAIEINGHIVRRSGKDYGVRTNDEYMESPYTFYHTQKELIEAIA